MSSACPMLASFQWKTSFIYINGLITEHLPTLGSSGSAGEAYTLERIQPLEVKAMGYNWDAEPTGAGPSPPGHVSLLQLRLLHSFSPTVPFSSFFLMFNPTNDGRPEITKR